MRGGEIGTLSDTRFETSPNPRNDEVSNQQRRRFQRAKLSVFQVGTEPEVNSPIIGVPALLALSTGRGGARNTGHRESHALTSTQIGNLIAATQQATSIGLAFTRMITIHWQRADVPLTGMTAATGHFLDLLSKALARHGSETAWIWTHESGNRKGGHCHILVHVPAALVPILTRLQKKWLRAITGLPYRARVILSKPIGGRLGLDQSNVDLHAVNLDVALVYLLKGADLDAAAMFGLGRLEMGGRVIGKRCGTSQNIGAKARRMAANS